MTILSTLREQRAVRRSRLDEILPETRTEELTEAENVEIGGLLAEIAQFDERIGDLAALETREAANEATRRELGQVNCPAESVRVTSEPRVYTAESGNQWINDSYMARFHQDPRAVDRLNRYARENEVHKRDVGTAAFGASIPPEYLLNQYAELLRAGRPVANACQQLALPPNSMSLTIPRGTTGTTTDVQAAEFTEVAEQDYDETPLTVPVITVAGQQDVSRQALERGQGIDTLLFADLVSSFSVSVDREVLDGTGVGGHAVGISSTGGIQAVTYTDASATFAEFYPKLADATQRILSQRFLPPTAILMHPRRWGWLTAATDTAGRPMIITGSPQNAPGTGSALTYGQVVGTIQGLPVITDANIGVLSGVGTNEDTIYVARMQDCLLWEDNGGQPRELRFEEPLGSKLAVKLVVYGYMAFTAARYPKAIASITGTGLIAPTF
jgi:HK97 family phage major capsid protein